MSHHSPVPSSLPAVLGLLPPWALAKKVPAPLHLFGRKAFLVRSISFTAARMGSCSAPARARARKKTTERKQDSQPGSLAAIDRNRIWALFGSTNHLTLRKRYGQQFLELIAVQIRNVNARPRKTEFLFADQRFPARTGSQESGLLHQLHAGLIDVRCTPERIGKTSDRPADALLQIGLALRNLKFLAGPTEC
jgi:hypothetical protein